MSIERVFPTLSLHDLQPTLESIRTYSMFIGRVRRAMAPRQKHWYHVSLQVTVNGLTTTPIPAGPFTFEMGLDLISHKQVVATSRGEQWQRPLVGQSAAQFCEEGLAVLDSLGIRPEIDRSLFSNTNAGEYDGNIAQGYFRALVQVDVVMNRFRSELREETSPVQLWPHNFDLAMLWFSGRLVPGTDPADEEYADEQMNFGFAPGDDTIPVPYFYSTAYPRPDGLTDTTLPAGAVWQTEGFTGAVMTYDSLISVDDPAGTLLHFFRTVQQAGADLMR